MTHEPFVIERTYNASIGEVWKAITDKKPEVITGRKLKYSWRYDGYEGNSFVTFELFAEGNSTRLKLTHEGLETFPINNPDFRKENFVEGWTQLIGLSLKEFLEKSAE